MNRFIHGLQDLFASGAIKSATDFQVYKEIGHLSGLDFAYTDNSAVYHTKVLVLSLVIFFITIWKLYHLLQHLHGSQRT